MSLTFNIFANRALRNHAFRLGARSCRAPASIQNRNSLASFLRKAHSTQASPPPEHVDVSIDGHQQPDPVKAHSTQANPPPEHVSVSIDGHQKIFDPVFLRDSCTCTQCVDPHSKQKLFQTSDIPEDLTGSCKTLVDDDERSFIELEWKNDVKGYGSAHRTRHSVDWLRRALNTESELKGGVPHDEKVLWNKESITKDNKWIDYKDWMGQDEVLFDALSHLNNYGLLFLKNVPESEESVVDIAGRIGTLKDTFYGRTWDVRSKAKAENIAYTPQFLGLHMDLLYTSNPPHLQFLHSLRARTPGGESFFSDAFYAARQLQQDSATHFHTLCTYPVTYHYHHASHHYHFRRPTIELLPRARRPRNKIIKTIFRRVNWSPPFQGPFEVRIGGEEQQASLRNYLSASHAYEKLLSAEENLFEHRLNEGECVIFDNRRVLHARKAFDATKGERWLKGAYLDDDVFFSKLRVLEERYTEKWEAYGVVRPALKS